MKDEYNRKTEFTKEELIEIMDSFLEYKPVFKKISPDDPDYTPLDSYPYDDESNRYVGYDYTQVDAAWRVTDVIFEYHIEDRHYNTNFVKIQEKYGVRDVKGASREKLDFLEIITIFTLMVRAYHWDDRGNYFEGWIEDNSLYNLLCRLEEIRCDL